MLKAHENSIFLGWGNQWTHNEAQVVYDLLKRDVEAIVGKQKVLKGKGYIHGLLEREIALNYDLGWADGHTLIAGASGSGKTQFLNLVLKQLIMRGETCIVLDPKGDKDLRKIAKEGCEQIGKPERYAYWHPAFPEDSIRLNPLKNFSRSSEIAARVTALIPDDGDSFYRDMANTIVQYIVDGMIMLSENITLVNIRYYYDHFGELLHKCCIKLFEANNVNWRDALFTKLEKTNDEEEKALICYSYYKNKVRANQTSSVIDSMAKMYIEKRRQLEQSSGNLMANLSKVTNGVLGDLLSPQDNPNDNRASYDMNSIIKSNMALVIGTDSLSDRLVSSAIGKMILADAAAVASDRYNYSDDDEKVINLFVDEASEMLCEPLIQMVNKARGARFRLWIATQTISDLTAELGSEAKADQIIASTNNFISFRCADTATQERVCAKNPMTKVKYVMRTQGFNSSNDDVDGLGANIGERLMEEEAELFPKELMGQLPDLEYVASFVGGTLVKGRIPVLIKKEVA